MVFTVIKGLMPARACFLDRLVPKFHAGHGAKSDLTADEDYGAWPTLAESSRQVTSSKPFCHGEFGAQNHLMATNTIFQRPETAKLGTTVEGEAVPGEGGSGEKA